ncbi:MAG TPA: glycosyltransferase family 9 protein, partial [Myxococcota bacterium]|nr:glycosyltransferase family 9 protein [Myxococcota bacterium]
IAAGRYAVLLNRLYRELPFWTLVISEPKDRERAQQIFDGLQMPKALHFPRHFDEFMVLLSYGDLYFVGDGGIGHLGAALGKKEVLLYGSSDPHVWSPLNREAEWFYHPEHVDRIDDHLLFDALKKKLNEVHLKI